jgi:hypothetical protein
MLAVLHIFSLLKKLGKFRWGKILTTYMCDLFIYSYTFVGILTLFIEIPQGGRAFKPARIDPIFRNSETHNPLRHAQRARGLRHVPTATLQLVNDNLFFRIGQNVLEMCIR